MLFFISGPTYCILAFLGLRMNLNFHASFLLSLLLLRGLAAPTNASSSSMHMRPHSAVLHSPGFGHRASPSPGFGHRATPSLDFGHRKSPSPGFGHRATASSSSVELFRPKAPKGSQKPKQRQWALRSRLGYSCSFHGEWVGRYTLRQVDGSKV